MTLKPRAACRKVALLGVLALAACIAPSTEEPGEAPRQEDSPHEPSPKPASPSSPDLVQDWTAGIWERPDPEEWAPGDLVEVRTGSHEGFDRIVFVYRDRLPGFHIEYVDKPYRQCGSGRALWIDGEGWLEIRATPASAHDEEGRPTVEDMRRRPGLPVLRELRLTCDFEGTVIWVAGVASPEPYRVLELSDPPRLVVDVKHPGGRHLRERSALGQAAALDPGGGAHLDREQDRSLRFSCSTWEDCRSLSGKKHDHDGVADLPGAQSHGSVEVARTAVQ